MLTTDDITHFIASTVDIVPESEDSVFLGVFSIPDSPATLHAIMGYVTRYYDVLLEHLALTPLQRITFQMQRCFTYNEYKTLFNMSVKQTDYHKHPIFRTLLITNADDRLLFIRKCGDDDYAAYVAFLEAWSKVHNQNLNSHLYGIHD